MHNFSLNDTVWQKLTQFRQIPELKWDARDHGNFYGTFYTSSRETLRELDPTGMTDTALLVSMIDAAINGMTLPLRFILENPEQLTALREPLEDRAQLLETDAGRAVIELMSKAQKQLPPGLTMQDFSICLRDALFGLHKHFHTQRIRFEALPDLRKQTLNTALFYFSDMKTLLDSLHTEFPTGLFLCGVGESMVFVFNFPGCQFLLSSLTLCEHTSELRGGASNCRRIVLDFDTLD